MSTGQYTQFPIDWQSIDASQIPYDHTTSGLTATDVQDALDELAQGGGGGGSVSPYTSNPAALGTASPGSSANYSRGDHVHPKPSAGDIGAIAAPSSPTSGDVLGYNGSAWVATTPSSGSVSSVNGQTGAVVLDADDVGAQAAITEVTVSSTGAVSQALDAGKIYHFTGALTALTITLTAPATGQLAHYHFDFVSGSTAATLTMPVTVTMQDSFAVEASKRYEVDVLNNYGAVMTWATS